MKNENGYCIDCGKEKEYQTDIFLCHKCMKNYDTDKLWKDHNNNKIDALDFNENEEIRRKYRQFTCASCNGKYNVDFLARDDDQICRCCSGEEP